MILLFELLSGALFSISANIDNIPIGLSYGVKKVHISILKNIIICVFTSCATFLSMIIGQNIANLFDIKITNMIGSILLIFLGIYFVLEITMDGVILHYANSILYKEESKLTRKLGFYTYKKALCLPPVAYEKMSSGEIINRITSDADTLSFAFGRLLNMISSLVASIIVIVYVFINSWIIGLEIVGIVSILFLILKKYNPLLKKTRLSFIFVQPV